MSPRRVIVPSRLPIIVTALAVLVILFHYQVSIRDLAAYTVYLSLGIALPGVLAWRLLLAGLHTGADNPPTWFEDLSLGTIFGFGLQLPVFLLGVWIGFPLLVVVLPVAAVVASLTPIGRRVWTLPTGSLDVRASWGLALTCIYGLVWLGHNGFAIRPLNLPSNRPPSIDETFHHALVSEVGHRFPPQIPFLLHTPLDYHWFVHAQIATADATTTLGPIPMLREVMPAVMLVLSVVGLGAVTLRLTGRPVAAVIAPALLVVGAYQLIGPHYDAYQFSEPFLSRRFISSPSQPYGVVVSMPALMLILEVLRPARKAARLTWLALVLALLALSGAKATFMPIFLCGAVAALVLTLVFARRLDRTLSLLAVLLLAVTVFAQVVLFGGQSGGMAFDPWATVRAALANDSVRSTAASNIAMTMFLLSSWLLYGVGVVGLTRARRWQDPRVVWLVFSIPAGIAVAFVLYRSGLSQLWFQRSVAELVVLVSAWGLAYVLPRPFARRQAALYGGGAAVAGLVAYGLSSLAESRRALVTDATLNSLVATVALPAAIGVVLVVVDLVVRHRPSRTEASWSTTTLGISLVLGLGLMNVYSLGYDIVSSRPQHQPEYPPLWKPGGVAAAEYIAHHSPDGDIVATNVHCVRPHAPKCDNRSFWVSAYSERRVVIEGWGYTAATNKHFVAGEANAFVPTPDPRRLRLNDTVFKHPSAAAVSALVAAFHPSWLFVSKAYPADVPGLKALDVLTRVYHNNNFIVFKINAKAG